MSNQTFEDDKQLLQSNSITPIENPKTPRRNRKGFLRWVAEIIGLVQSYTADDISRLKEAGIGMVEAKTSEKNAMAVKLMAEAAEIHARTENERLKTKGNDTLKKAEALEKVAQVISIIKQNGGDVAFDLPDLMRLLEGDNIKENKL